MTSAQPCKWCEKPIVVRMVRGGRALPFNRDMVRGEQAGPASYVPVSSGGRVVLVPVTELSEKRLAVQPWRAVRHVCAQWAAAHRPDDGVEDLATAVAKALGLDADELAEASR
jgi:hypothetical protein